MMSVWLQSKRFDGSKEKLESRRILNSHTMMNQWCFELEQKGTVREESLSEVSEAVSTSLSCLDPHEASRWTYS